MLTMKKASSLQEQGEYVEYIGVESVLYRHVFIQYDFIMNHKLSIINKREKVKNKIDV